MPYKVPPVKPLQPSPIQFKHQPPRTKYEYRTFVPSTPENLEAARKTAMECNNMKGAHLCSLISCVAAFIGVCMLINCASNGCFDANPPSPNTCPSTCDLGIAIALTVVGTIATAVGYIFSCATKS